MQTINSALEAYIFNRLNAVYAPDAIAAKNNLNNDTDKNRNYLGTYFPRTFVESYNIYYRLFQNQAIYNCYRPKELISILIIGSGTGGDLLGLLQVLNECFHSKEINIYSFDGNQDALNIQKQLIRDFYQFMPNRNNRITVYTYPAQFSCVNDVAESLRINNIPFIDIMQSFKMCNELYNQSNDKQVFYQLTALAEQYLSPNGIFVLEDVTNRNDDQRFNSVVMSDQVRNYFRQNPHSNLRYIIPVCCGKWYNRCTWSHCLSIVEYRIFHRYAPGEKSKVAYKVMIKQPLGQLLYDSIETKDAYLLAPRTYCTKDNYLYNQDFPPCRNVADPYKL